MNRPFLLSHLLAWLGAFPIAGLAADQPRRPHVLMIAVDDLNDWVGCLGGHAAAHTPHIDRLARRGVLFTNAHCRAPACNPSRAALFSGQPPWATGVWSNESQRLFRNNVRTCLCCLEPCIAPGYLTLGAGKLMHSGATANRLMMDRHFDVEQRWSPFTRKAVEYTAEELPSKGTESPGHVVHVAGLPVVTLPLNRMPSDRNPESTAGESFDWGPIDVPDSAMGDAQIVDWAIQQLNAPATQPTFLGVGFYRPHIPLWAPRKYFQRFEGKAVALPPVLDTDLEDLSPAGKRWAIEAITAGLHSTVVKHGEWEAAVRAYLACTTFVDAQIGRLLDALDQSAWADDTLVVLWSDHGWHLGEKQHWGKWTGWERSTRVPLIVVPPRRDAEQYAKLGHTCSEPVSLMDVYPTLIDMCGVDRPEFLSGQSLAPLARDPDARTERVVLTTFDPGNVSLRSRDWRYIRYADRSEELYDLRDDPNEWRNLANQPRQAERPPVVSGTRIPAAALQAK